VEAEVLEVEQVELNWNWAALGRIDISTLQHHNDVYHILKCSHNKQTLKTPLVLKKPGYATAIQQQ
jgi:hypothetical protein